MPLVKHPEDSLSDTPSPSSNDSEYTPPPDLASEVSDIEKPEPSKKVAQRRAFILRKPGTQKWAPGKYQFQSVASMKGNTSRPSILMRAKRHRPTPSNIPAPAKKVKKSLYATPSFVPTFLADSANELSSPAVRYERKDYKFIEQQERLKFPQASEIGKAVQEFGSSLTASDIRLEIRTMNDAALVDSLVDSIDSALNENKKLVAEMEKMHKNMLAAERQYGKFNAEMDALRGQITDRDRSIEQLRAENDRLKKRLKKRPAVRRAPIKPSNTNVIPESSNDYLARLVNEQLLEPADEKFP